MSRERAMIFCGGNVNAILEGRKNVTRRCNVVLPDFPPAAVNIKPEVGADGWVHWSFDMPRKNGEFQPCSIQEWQKVFKAGQRLWVRETWWEDLRDKDNDARCIAYDATPNLFKEKSTGKYIRATYLDEKFVSAEDSLKNITNHPFWKRKASMFMPRWASRITLEATGSRIERLQDITEQDAIAEGIVKDELLGQTTWHGASSIHYTEPIEAYKDLWESINGKTPGATWTDNPWVWVVSFKVLEGGTN